MPTSGRGGKRKGAPGAAYPNRSDIRQAPRAVPNQPYGTATAQLTAQRAQPLSAAPPPGHPAPAAAPQAPPIPSTPLTAPTMRPNEPITAGLPMGAGAGPEALGTQQLPTDPLIAQLRGLYMVSPNRDIARLLDAAEAAQGL